MATETVRTVIAAQDQTRGVLEGVRKRFKGITGEIFNVRNALGGLAAGFAGRQLFRIGQDLVGAFTKQQRAVEGLNAALAQTGQLSEANSRLIQEQASALQRVTTAGDEALIEVSTTVAQLAKDLSPRELAQVQQAVIGISDALGVDLQSAAQLVGKTIGSQTNALSRYGIRVDTTASQSQKLAQIMEQSAGFFEVAKARTDTLAGAQQQLKNAYGDLKEELGGILVDVLNLGGGTKSLTERIFGAIEAIQANRAVIVAWSQVVLRAGQVFLEAGKTIIRAAFNLGQIVGNIFRGLGKLIVGVFTFDLALVKEAIGETKDAIAQDVGDIVDGFESWADALLAVAEAAERARTASTSVAADARTATQGGNVRLPAPGSRVPAPIAPLPVDTGGVDPLALRPATLAPAVDVSAFVDVPAILRDAAAAAADFKGPVEEAGNSLADAAGVMIASVGSAAEAMIRGGRDIEQTIISTVTQIAQALVAMKAQQLGSAAGPLGTVIGAVGGIAAALFGGGGGGRSRPIAVAVESVSPRAAADLQRRSGPDAVTIVIEQGGVELRRVQHDLRRLERRGGRIRIPAGVGLGG